MGLLRPRGRASLPRLQGCRPEASYAWVLLLVQVVVTLAAGRRLPGRVPQDQGKEPRRRSSAPAEHQADASRLSAVMCRWCRRAVGGTITLLCIAQRRADAYKTLGMLGVKYA